MREVERQRGKKNLSEWEERRRGLRRRLRISEDWMKRIREEEEGKIERIARGVRKRIEEMEGESRRRKIEEAKYNVHYKEIATKERPDYIKRRIRKKERSLLTRFRCGNEARGRQHWREEDDRRCRVCKEEKETIWHVIGRCVAMRSGLGVEEVLRGTGEGARRDEEITAGKEKENRRRGKRLEGRVLEGIGRIDIKNTQNRKKQKKRQQNKTKEKAILKTSRR